MHDAEGSKSSDVAAEWFVRLRDDDVSTADRAAFEAWLAADPTHMAAYEEVKRVWMGLDELDICGQSSPFDQDAGHRAARAADRTVQSAASAERRSTWRRLAAAAVFVTALALGGYVMLADGLFADHKTKTGEQTSVTLADGTAVDLNTASALSVEFSDNARHVTLHRGEAYFEVVPDPNRPFTVAAGMGRVTVLGTAFSAKRMGGTLTVVVAENRVEVVAIDGATALIKDGQGVRVTGSGLGPVGPRELSRALAWRRGRLVFDNAPLGDVLAELERYRPGRILVIDTQVEDLPVTGAFMIANHEQALATIEQTLPVRLLRISDWLVLAVTNAAG